MCVPVVVVQAEQSFVVVDGERLRFTQTLVTAAAAKTAAMIRLTDRLNHLHTHTLLLHRHRHATTTTTHRHTLLLLLLLLQLQPFNGPLDFVQNYPGEPVPER